MPLEKLTKLMIDTLPVPDKRVTYWDTELKGFSIRISNKAKIYYATKRINGKPQWVKIGEHGVFTPDSARKEALKILSDLSKGINVNKEKARARTKGISLEKVMEMYLGARQNLRPKTIKSYEGVINNNLSEWTKTPMEDITGEMVSQKHLDIAKKAGQAQANKSMMVLRLLYNYLIVITDKQIENPVRRLSMARQWFPAKRKKTMVKKSELNTWYKAVMNFSNPVASDYLVLLLFSGLRECEGMTLRWSDVDMENRTFTVREEVAKNHQEHTLPMSDIIFDIFNRRLKRKECNWVFPGFKEGSHLTEVRRAIEHVTKRTRIKWSLHDLRRTFSTFAEQEVSYAMLKRLLNHAQSSDVTAGYLVITTEDLREPMQKVTNTIKTEIFKPEESDQAQVTGKNNEVMGSSCYLIQDKNNEYI